MTWETYIYWSINFKLIHSVKLIDMKSSSAFFTNCFLIFSVTMTRTLLLTEYLCIPRTHVEDLTPSVDVFGAEVYIKTIKVI